MFDHTLVSLGAFKLAAVVLQRGETCVEVLERRAIAVILIRGQARCNGVDLVPWRSMVVSQACRLQAIEDCIVARVAIEGEGAVHLGEGHDQGR